MDKWLTKSSSHSSLHRTLQHRKRYFAKCDRAITQWRNAGPQPLNTVPRSLTGEPLPPQEWKDHRGTSEFPIPNDEQDAEAEEKKEQYSDSQHASTRVTNLEVTLSEERSSKEGGTQTATHCDTSVGDAVTTAYGDGIVVSTANESGSVGVDLNYGRLFVRSTETLVKKGDNAKKGAAGKEVPASQCNSGIWLFTDRENVTHFFKPNFFPPYDTPEKRKIILDVLREEWDEKTLSWRPCGQGSMTKSLKSTMDDGSALSRLDELMCDVLSTINGCCTPQVKATSDTSSNK
jgi:hypothetical protein